MKKLSEKKGFYKAEHSQVADGYWYFDVNNSTGGGSKIFCRKIGAVEKEVVLYSAEFSTDFTGFDNYIVADNLLIAGGIASNCLVIKDLDTGVLAEYDCQHLDFVPLLSCVNDGVLFCTDGAIYYWISPEDGRLIKQGYLDSIVSFHSIEVAVN